MARNTKSLWRKRKIMQHHQEETLMDKIIIGALFVGFLVLMAFLPDLVGTYGN